MVINGLLHLLLESWLKSLTAIEVTHCAKAWLRSKNLASAGLASSLSHCAAFLHDTSELRTRQQHGSRWPTWSPRRWPRHRGSLVSLAPLALNRKVAKADIDSLTHWLIERDSSDSSSKEAILHKMMCLWQKSSHDFNFKKAKACQDRFLHLWSEQ